MLILFGSFDLSLMCGLSQLPQFDHPRDDVCDVRSREFLLSCQSLARPLILHRCRLITTCKWRRLLKVPTGSTTTIARVSLLVALGLRSSLIRSRLPVDDNPNINGIITFANALIAFQNIVSCSEQAQRI